MEMKIQVLARKDSKSLIHQEWPRLEYASFFENSDIITLHCPLTDSNKHLINNESLSIMKKTSYLINTSRGDLVDESALAIALNEKSIAGAAVDVLSEEPPPSDHCLINESIPNLLVSPHIAWISVESRKRLINGVSSNIKAFLNKSPINQVS